MLNDAGQNILIQVFVVNLHPNFSVTYARSGVAGLLRLQRLSFCRYCQMVFHCGCTRLFLKTQNLPCLFPGLPNILHYPITWRWNPPSLAPSPGLPAPRGAQLFPPLRPPSPPNTLNLCLLVAPWRLRSSGSSLCQDVWCPGHFISGEELLRDQGDLQ